MKLKRNYYFVFVSLILTFVFIGLVACTGIGEKDTKVVKQQEGKKRKDAGPVPEVEEVRSLELREKAAPRGIAQPWGKNRV
jgi:uncharacterized membrane protein